jgi:hypothetical protein
MPEMKYSVQDYVDSNFYGGSEDVVGYVAKVVRIHRGRPCVYCSSPTSHGEMMLRETCIIPGEGRKSAYTCLPCIDKWLDQIKGKTNV